MTIKKEDIKKKVLEWITFADEDLRAAIHALKLSSGCPYRIVAFHAQQCAEKYIKAFLVYKKKDFPYIHNIARLLELCMDYGSWPKDLLAAAKLTGYAAASRYPGEAKVSKKEALESVELASLTRKTVRSALKREGLIL